MSNTLNNIFPKATDQIMVVATINGLVQVHETISEGGILYTRFTQEILIGKGEGYAFSIKMDEEQIVERMDDNFRNQIELRENFANNLENGKLNRYDFDLFVMELFSNILALDTVIHSVIDIVSNNFAIEVDSIIDENDTKDFIQILADNVAMAKGIVKVYGGLD